MPSTAIFPVAFPDPGCVSQHAFGLGLPLHPTCALVATPIERDGPPDLSLVSPSLLTFSVGKSPTKRVVLSPRTLKEIPPADLARALREKRRLTDETHDGVLKLKRLVREGFAVAGIRPAVDRAGRFRPFKP